MNCGVASSETERSSQALDLGLSDEEPGPARAQTRGDVHPHPDAFHPFSPDPSAGGRAADAP
jgi:hypothetical protein